MNESSVCQITDRCAGERLRSRHFEDATASVAAALDELRRHEQTLERQLADLRSYIRIHTAPANTH